jgi:adenylylsulfate kinase-like enzyme
VDRIAWIASRLARAGVAVIVAAISPYAEGRRRARVMIDEHARFIEVHVHAPVDVCAARDPKGLYARALANDLLDLTGISAPYETPSFPEVRVDTTRISRHHATSTIVAYLTAADLTPSSMQRDLSRPQVGRAPRAPAV